MDVPQCGHSSRSGRWQFQHGSLTREGLGLSAPQAVHFFTRPRSAEGLSHSSTSAGHAALARCAFRWLSVTALNASQFVCGDW